jgi:3-oxoacyl-[acyl-carrier-protein] synthase II
MYLPIGNSIATAWDAAKAGKSGIATITKFDATPFSTHFAGEVKDFNVEDYIPAKEARNMDTFIHFGIAAGMQAFQDREWLLPKRMPSVSVLSSVPVSVACR